jgi:glycyl-tRNA synthetase beta chain
MAQYLLEILSEEIPARMQAGAARDLERMALEGLKAAGLDFTSLSTFAGPRRLTLVVEGLPVTQADRQEERRGPKVSAPAAALEGFLRSTGLDRAALEDRDGVWFATLLHPGRPTAQILAELAAAIIAKFPWPKSMTSGTGSLRWVRPIRGLLSLFDGQVTPFSIEGLAAGDTTLGHRVMGLAEPVQVRDFASYAEALEQGFVVLSAERRKGLILDGARALAAARGLELVEDAGLLEEVAGMVEWPVPLLGDMDPAFLDLPPEVARTTMRVHQRYFAVREPGAAGLAPHFICIANLAAADGGALIAAGNGRVLSARLGDARFFWDEDRKTPLAARLERLAGVTFHAKLGTLRDRAARLETGARLIATRIGADAEAAALAGRLAKADLASGMVGEFPELQGVMGGYYARHEGLGLEVAQALAEQYRPQGPSDQAPSAPVAMALALAEKLDTLIGFFSIGEAPTGSRDPFALRRAALGVIRIILENRLRLPLGALIADLAQDRAPPVPVPADLLPFIFDRLKVALRDQGGRPDLAEAVFALGDDDLPRATARITALADFLATEDGANLLAGFKRASNILAAEAKKGPLPTGESVRAAAPPEEAALFDALAACAPKVETALGREAYDEAMAALAGLRGPVDAFFEKVLVNSEVAQERTNRLRLLGQIRALMRTVADFGLITS